MEVKIQEVVINIHLNKKGQMRAQVTLEFGEIRISGYRVLENSTSHDLFVLPPSVMRGKQIVYVMNQQKWKVLEQNIIEKYKQEQKKFDDETIDIPDNSIDANTLPF